MNPILTAACRTSQAVGSLKNSLQKQTSCALETGPLAGLGLPARLSEEKVEKPLLLLSREDDAGKAALIAALTEAGVDYALWEMKEPLRLQDVENIRLFALGERCDAFLALGEPWLLCAGKLAALRMAQPGKTAEELMAGSAGRKRWPLYVIPTAPKGAAVSEEVWAKDKRGYWLRKKDPAFVPAVCLLDAALMPKQSREEHIEQSLCLFALCLEEALNPRREEKRASLLVAAEDILNDLRALAEERFVPTAEYYRRIMESALWQGGYASVLAEEATRMLEIKKGTALAAILPALLQEYWKRAPQTISHLDGMTANASAVQEDMEEEFRFVLLDELRGVFASLGLPERLPALTEEQIILLANKCRKQVNPEIPCPCVLGRRELRGLLSLCSEAAPLTECLSKETGDNQPEKRSFLACFRRRKTEAQTDETDGDEETETAATEK